MYYSGQGGQKRGIVFTGMRKWGKCNGKLNGTAQCLITGIISIALTSATEKRSEDEFLLKLRVEKRSIIIIILFANVCAARL